MTLTPAVVKQEVNFFESSEISWHRTTVNLRTHNRENTEVQLKYRSISTVFKQKIHIVLLRQDAGLRAAVAEEHHLSQFVEELDGSSRQLRQTPDGCSMDLLKNVNMISQ